MKKTLREHIEQLVKDYSSLILKYETRIEQAQKSKSFSDALFFETKKCEMESVIKDLEESLR